VTEDDAKRRIADRVSRETFERLEIYEQVLRKWQPKLNLVANGTLPELWARHFLDSVQLIDLAPETDGLWLDLGSGGGFPGMVCAISLADTDPAPGFALLESDTRKCAFLREVARQTGVSVDVRNSRIEVCPPAKADIVSARALAPLPRLLDWVHRHLRPDGLCLLQKGANHAMELETARADWQMDVDVEPSMTAPDSVILRIRNLSHA
jgi:16S rRNA (guanine527-N7)-methyltransferase